MNIDTLSSLMNDGIILILTLSLPSIGLGLVIGLIIAIFQALTQIQEQSLTFVPKMIIVMLMLMITVASMASQLVAFCEKLWTMIPTLR
ncbi:flagellar biosynthetic protein FliQ [Candidatus Termititenax aidoneus]|uniref:Flagellar biosynthetic protein FliQ n=1 Tax=Termititenax aidoneus TaxID=2218524 RepID=A0A388T963_TERA1|nr:flagellar biosynthetic protein FliQ [Candidatus Termititenax aidoneus]